MPDYSKSKIYKITCNVTGVCYIGSTVQELEDRMSNHKSAYNGGYLQCMSREVFKNNNYIYEVIEDYPCENKIELWQREQYHLDLNRDNCVNKQKAYGPLTEEEEKKYWKDYHITNREKACERANKWYETHKEYAINRSSLYAETNKEKIKKYQQHYRDSNKEKLKEYAEKNKAKIAAQRKERDQKKKAEKSNL